MNKSFKIAIMTFVLMATLTQCTNSNKDSQNEGSTSDNYENQLTENVEQLEPRDRNCFHHRHFNSGGVCLHSSYAFLLEYANSTDEHIAPFDNFDVMDSYMKFHNLEEECPQISAEYFRDNQESAEKEMSAVINNYCITRGWSGYLRLNQFHDWLKENSDWAANIEFVKRRPEALNNNGQPMNGAYKEIAEYLEQNADPDAEYDYVALICYSTPSGLHSVLLGYDQDYFIRDVNNYDRYVDINSSFDFHYGPDAPILEYDLFKVQRQPKGIKEWKDYDATRFQASEKAEEEDFMVLDNPIPLKHLRVTAIPYGEDGNRACTDIRIRSFNDPTYQLDYGNYFGNPLVKINGELYPLGQRTANGLYEFDLGQISDDLYIWGYQPNFNFESFSYQ